MSSSEEKKFHDVLSGHSTEELAQRFMVSLSTVEGWRLGKLKPHPIAMRRIIEAMTAGEPQGD